jgi:hypothetical protein
MLPHIHTRSTVVQVRDKWVILEDATLLPSDSQYIQLRIRAQAGTYIKVNPCQCKRWLTQQTVATVQRTHFQL